MVGIDVRNLHSNGGMIHCVTQQPAGQNHSGYIEKDKTPDRYRGKLSQNSPNPFSDSTTISFTLKKGSFVKLEVFNYLGQKVNTIINSKLPAGEHAITLMSDDYENGIHTYILTIEESIILSKKMMVIK